MAGNQLRQSMTLGQQLRMTPQLQQAIKLLQLSRLELESAVRSELEENPILEETLDIKEDDVQKLKDASLTADGTSEGDGNSNDPKGQDEFDWESYYEANSKPIQSSIGSGNEEIQNYENVITTSQTLHEHLNFQIKMGGFNDEEELYLSILASYVDDDGYIKTDMATIAAEENVGEPELTENLPFLQEFDPPGVGARDLKECLILQAKHLEEDTHDLVHLINNHLKDLEKKNYDGIAKTMNLPMETVVELCKIIYTMEPKPGRSFAVNDTQYVTPDVYVYKVGDDYVVSLNEDGLPRLKISNFYKNIMKTENKPNESEKKTQDYIQDKLRSAVWLIKSIHQRNRTIYKVADSIVKHQREFFDKGTAFLKPMILRDIASDIGMHESTVSRVTTSKYMHTPQGIYELKYFFNSGISGSDGGDSLASEAVKLKIKELVNKEDPKRPLSDQQIVDLLKKDGLTIARRTVAKYRDILRIQPSSRRKKLF